MLTLEQIKGIIPHRDPVLMLDEADDPDYENMHITGRKMVNGDEELLHGHFPGNAVMPGVMLIEALAQLGAILVLSMEKFKGKIAVLGGIEKFKFRRMVKPGDHLELDVQIDKLRSSAGIGHGRATVNGELACEGQLTFFIV